MEYELDEMEGVREMNTDIKLDSDVKSNVVGVSMSVAERRRDGTNSPDR